MSFENKFEKTFSRKKKDSNNGDERTKEELNELVIALASPSHQPKTSKKRIHGGDRSKTSAKKGAQEPFSNKFKKIKVIHSSITKQNQGKDETQKQRIKVEKGGGDIEEVKKTNNGENQGKVEESSECTFPMNRIVRIIKSEGSDCRLSQEAVFLINKATEKFIELFSKDAYDCALQDKKRFIGYKHLSSAVGKEKRLDFLSDFVPEKVATEKALAERKPAETLPS